jgi:hypothetical protein
MLPIITGREGDLINIEVTINLSGSMLEAEDSILRARGEYGRERSAVVHLAVVICKATFLTPAQ